MASLEIRHLTLYEKNNSSAVLGRYVLIPLGGRPNLESFRINQNANYQYDLFQRLMLMLKEEYEKTKIGFWCNRHLLLKQVSDMSILLTEDRTNIVAFQILNSDGTIDFFQVFDQGKGIGRMLIEHDKMYHDDELVVYDALPESVLFWQRVGIRICSPGKY